MRSETRMAGSSPLWIRRVTVAGADVQLGGDFGRRQERLLVHSACRSMRYLGRYRTDRRCQGPGTSSGHAAGSGAGTTTHAPSAKSAGVPSHCRVRSESSASHARSSSAVGQRSRRSSPLGRSRGDHLAELLPPERACCASRARRSARSDDEALSHSYRPRLRLGPIVQPASLRRWKGGVVGGSAPRLIEVPAPRAGDGVGSVTMTRRTHPIRKAAGPVGGGAMLGGALGAPPISLNKDPLNLALLHPRSSTPCCMAAISPSLVMPVPSSTIATNSGGIGGKTTSTRVASAAKLLSMMSARAESKEYPIARREASKAGALGGSATSFNASFPMDCVIPWVAPSRPLRAHRPIVAPLARAAGVGDELAGADR